MGTGYSLILLLSRETNMAKLLRIGILCVVALSLQGCVTNRLAADLLIGKWQSDLGGFPVLVEYSESTVTVGNHASTGYQLENDQLTFADGGNQVRILSFPGRNEMIQFDPLTGTRHEFRRLE